MTLYQVLHELQIVLALILGACPRPPSAARPAGHSSGTPGPPRSVTSTRTRPSPALTATVTVPPAAPDRLYRTLLPKSSVTSRAASSPHGCPGPSTPPTNARAIRARSARPATVTLSRTSSPAISAATLPARTTPGEATGPPGGHTGMHARLNGSRQAGTRDRRGPSVAVRGSRRLRRPSWRPDAVRYLSVDTATQGPTALQSNT
jgi:hypothetical protein